MEERMIRMDEFNKIRKAHYVDGLSINEIAIKFQRSWATINTIVKKPRDKILSDDSEKKRKCKVASQEVIDAIVEWLEKEDKINVKKKQRSKAKKIFEELTRRGIYKGSQRRMQDLVNDVRSRLAPLETKNYLPLEFPLGSAAQVDHGEVECIINGFRSIHYLFIMSVPGMVLRYCQLFPTKAQEAWGEFHERGFNFFKGIFQRIIYDNDTVLIKDAKGKMMTNFGLHLIEHYGFQSAFCNPASGNEKGSVENAVGFCRRNYLNGCPIFENSQQANIYLEKKCNETIANENHYKSGKPLITIKAELEKELMPLLPAKKWRRWASPKVNSYQQIEIDHHMYSVPVKFVSEYLRVAIEAFKISIFFEEQFVIEHERKFAPGVDSLILDHYLDQLCEKPGALWDCKAMQEYSNDKVLIKLWEKLISAYPALPNHQAKIRGAQKEFIQVLMLRRRYSEVEWKEGITKALEYGATEAAAIECIIRGISNPQMTAKPKDVKEKLSHVHIPTWNCELSAYADLMKVEGTC